jgi:hypothetical protein
METPFRKAPAAARTLRWITRLPEKQVGQAEGAPPRVIQVRMDEGLNISPALAFREENTSHMGQCIHPRFLFPKNPFEQTSRRDRATC